MTNRTRIELTGALNLRDVGGYDTADGRRLRTGIVYRSDNFNSLTDEDLDVIDQLGIRSVFDFRGDREVEFQPSRLWPAVERVVRLPIAGDVVQEKTFTERVEARELVEITEADVAADYITILEERGTQYVPLLEAIADQEHAPLVFHCTAGKDRTGLAAALIHGLCGVAREDIAHDFSLSNEFRLPSRLAALTARFEPMGIDMSPLIPGLAAPAAAMAAALDHLDRVHGGIDGYVRDHLGVSDTTISAITEVLVA